MTFLAAMSATPSSSEGTAWLVAYRRIDRKEKWVRAGLDRPRTASPRDVALRGPRRVTPRGSQRAARADGPLSTGCARGEAARRIRVEPPTRAASFPRPAATSEASRPRRHRAGEHGGAEATRPGRTSGLGKERRQDHGPARGDPGRGRRGRSEGGGDGRGELDVLERVDGAVEDDKRPHNLPTNPHTPNQPTAQSVAAHNMPPGGESGCGSKQTPAGASAGRC